VGNKQAATGSVALSLITARYQDKATRFLSHCYHVVLKPVICVTKTNCETGAKTTQTFTLREKKGI
jgi:hypothetical protein